MAYNVTVERFREIMRILGQNAFDKLENTKRVEYTNPDEDKRLSAFEFIANELGISKSMACLVLMYKHIYSIVLKIRSGKPSTEDWRREKIGDLYNYCPLLFGCLEEEEMNYEL